MSIETYLGHPVQRVKERIVRHRAYDRLASLRWTG